MKKLIFILGISALAAGLVSCEKEDEPTDCQCKQAVYKNVVNGNQKSFYNEPVECVGGSATPLERVKGNYVFVECINKPKY